MILWILLALLTLFAVLPFLYLAQYRAKSANIMRLWPWRAANHPAAIGMVMLVIVPTASLGLYLELGTPDLADSAEQGRELSPIELIWRMEKYLSDNPQRADAWLRAGDLYLQLDLPVKAMKAFAEAIRLDSNNAYAETSWAVSRMQANEGIIDEAAHKAFQRALIKDGNAFAPKFFLALARAQEQDFAGAVQDFSNLLANGQLPAAWRKIISDERDSVQQKMKMGAR